MEADNKEFLKLGGDLNLDNHTFNRHKQDRKFTLEDTMPYEVMIYELQQEAR